MKLVTTRNRLSRVAGWVAGSIETKAISALKLELKLELAGAELGNKYEGSAQGCRPGQEEIGREKREKRSSTRERPSLWERSVRG